MIYFDSETCGLTGPMVLLQYAENDGPIVLHNIWTEPIPKTLQLLEWLADSDVCGFNLVFDWFHVVKIYNILRAFADVGYTEIPTVNSVAKVEATNPSKYCLRPRSALDLMLAARRGKYQYVMNRKPISIRRVPRVIASALCDELASRINLPEICFAKGGGAWEVVEKEEYPKDLVDVRLRFHGSTSLRALSTDILGEDKGDWPIPAGILPTELSYMPYGQYGNKPWALVIREHISMWGFHPKARYYAEQDVYLTRRLHKFGFPEESGGDVDSELACAVGATRWKGFRIDHEKVASLIPKFEADSKKGPRGHQGARTLLDTVLPEPEKLALQDTSKETLESIEKHSSSEKAREIARNILEARRAKLRHTMMTRLAELPRFHPEFKIIGTKSNRQSGGAEDKGKGGSINPQGIPRDPAIRSCFPFADENEELWGGDAKSFEITIIDAVMPDSNLHNELLTGKSFHGLMGEIWYGYKYDEIMNTKGQEDSKYDKVKSADFALFYGAEEKKLSDVLGLDDVSEAMQRGRQRFPELFRQREKLALQYCSMRQPHGLGTKVEWHEPKEYVESIFGFRRYFTLETEVCRSLYQLANKLPPSLQEYKQEVVRRQEKGTQKAAGATMSALYAAAFNIQAQVMRAACNHIIQSPGGEITKRLQYRLWNLQPKGVSSWQVRLFNMHDELMAVTTVPTQGIVKEFIEEYKQYVPLLEWEWERLKSWAEK